MLRLKVLLFANLRDLVGQRELLVELPEGSRVADLKAHLATVYPVLAQALTHAVAACNKEFAFEDTLLSDGAETAFFPQVSGGGALPTLCAIVEGPLDLDQVTASISLPSTGAVCLFTGMVRAITQGENAHQTLSLEYEAYIPMAEAKLHQIADEIRQRWPSVEGIALIQRIGYLPAGTPTVITACSAAHRDTGVFEATRYAIDRLKEIVPVWKKEVSPTGEIWVEGGYTPVRGD